MRLIGDPETRYHEDPVRMLRAVRLAAKLDFSIDPATAEPLPRLAPLLSQSAPARLFEECLKLFLSGHAEKSFTGLERHGLLGVLFPGSAKALAANRSGALRRVVIAGRRDTDRRVAAEEPVSPAFLFALLLWPDYCRTLVQLERDGLAPADAQRRAADRVTVRQLDMVALPRRFSIPMQEIWLLQSRFGLRQRKRVLRMLGHPRFRAAFDFLSLRLAGSDSHAADVEFWREAQAGGGIDQGAQPDAHARDDGDPDAGGAEDVEVGPGSRPRRRRRPRHRPAGPER